MTFVSFRWAWLLSLPVALSAAETLVAPSASAAEANTFVCGSKASARTPCETEGFVSVKLVKRLSKQPCRKDLEWGVDDVGLWVDHGCVARFSGVPETAVEVAPAAADQAPTDWVCSSVNSRTAHCAADVRHGVRFVEQLSQAPCVKNQTWGFDQGGIWVASGCSARFATVSASDVGRAMAIGGAVGAALGAPRSVNTTTIINNNVYYQRPYPTRWSAPPGPPAPSAYDLQQQALQQQRDSLDRREQALQKQLYQQNMQSQQDAIDREQEARQRQEYEDNQRRQIEQATAERQAEEAERQRQIQQGEEVERQQAAEAEAKAAEEAERQRQIQQGEEVERQQAAEAEAKAAEEAERQRQIQQGEEVERQQAAEAEAKAAEEAEQQRLIKQGEQDELNQAAGNPPDSSQ